MTEDIKYYSVREAMEILHRSRQTVFAYINAGLIKAIKLKPGAKNSKYIIPESELKRFIEAGGAPDGYYQALYPRPHKNEQAPNNI